jgi:hypothetical protein
MGDIDTFTMVERKNRRELPSRQKLTDTLRKSVKRSLQSANFMWLTVVISAVRGVIGNQKVEAITIGFIKQVGQTFHQNIRLDKGKIKIDIKQAKLKEALEFQFEHEDLIIYKENYKKPTIGLIKYKENESFEMLQADVCVKNKTIKVMKQSHH